MRLTQGAKVVIVQDIISLSLINTGDKQLRERNTSTERQVSNDTQADTNNATQLENAYQQQIEGNWKQFAGRVKEAWGVLTDDDVDRAEGKMEQLAGTIEEKTGEARASVARKLNELASSIQG